MNFHNNIFSSSGSVKEAYQSLKSDGRRDLRSITICDVVSAISALYLVRNWEWLDAIAAISLVLAVITRLTTFIDLSNRNFFMHSIDWRDQRDYEAKERAADLEWQRYNRPTRD